MSVNEQISNFSMIVFSVLMAVLFAFLIYSLIQNIRQKRKITRTQYYYIGLCLSFIIWVFAMLMMGFTPLKEENHLQFWDAVSNIGTDYAPLFMFLIALSVIKGERSFPKWVNLTMIIPAITVFFVFTNDYHHLVYLFHEGIEFSIIRKDFDLGPVLIIKGVISYVYLMVSVGILLWYSIRKKEKLVWKQSTALMVGAFVPLLVSVFATAGMNLGITATPLSFSVPILCNYIAIYRLNILNIVPLATGKVLDIIPDGFLIADVKHQILDTNEAFRNVSGRILELKKNDYLNEDFIADHRNNGGVLYTLLAAMNSCTLDNKKISYEQSMYFENPATGAMESWVFMIDIQVIEISNKFYGHIVVFRDITQLKQSLAKIQENRERLMEQERLALLGQMMGGMAHNLKTPIMSIAGGTSNIETLMQEISDSLGDSEVTVEDYREIVKETNGWLARIRESCAYMSEIINAVKGQAANATNSDERDFSVDELIRCTELLMKHELKNSNTNLTVIKKYNSMLMLHGDMNSLVQVLNNLISNAIFAEKDCERREIVLSAEQSEDCVKMRVRDNGPGIPPQVQNKLFREMITTKGTKGTGLGLYISSTIIRGKFAGEMWYEDAPEGGAVLGIRIPLKNALDNAVKNGET